MLTIVKIGTNLLTTNEGRLDLNNLRGLIDQIAALHKAGHRFIVVTSGAITCGSERMHICATSIPQKQAAAAVGQGLLMREYIEFFGRHGLEVGQILLTKDVLSHPIAKENALNTINTLLMCNVIPIINENDSVATDEIGAKFGDNDELSSLVAKLIQAGRLLLLTDIDGVFSSNPKLDAKATLLPELKIGPNTLKLAEDVSNGRSRGGMTSKLKSAKDATDAGIEVYIANGRNATVIADIFAGKPTGTRILRS
ncbi:MAG: glutamate 5-kinase [Candidatus Margulisiibacteriota bacterium]